MMLRVIKWHISSEGITGTGLVFVGHAESFDLCCFAVVLSHTE